MKTFKEHLFENNLNSTIIILEIHNFHNHFEKTYVGEIKELLDIFKLKIEELNSKYSDEFYLPIDRVGFSTEIAIKGENFKLAKIISQELYDTIKNFNPKIIVKICIGNGEISHLGKKLHFSNGPIFHKVGRYIDRRKNDGIEILD